MPDMDNLQLPLAGLRVVALEQAVAAPLCSRHLADLGADVIKIERPDGGDFARHYDSVVHGESAYFVWLNRGKRSVVADLRSEHGRAILDGVLARADVFVHNLGPGAVERLGYGWPALHARWPRLIFCAISGYGQDGPYRNEKAYDLLLQGESGLASVTGTSDAPARVGISIADISGGMYGLSAILAALVGRAESGQGTFLDISMLDAMAEWMSVPTLYQRYAGAPPARSGLHHATIAPYGPYQAADGPSVLIAVQNDGQWARFCDRVLEAPHLAADPRFATNELRVRNRGAMDGLIGRHLAAVSRATLVDRLNAADVPHAALNEVADLLTHPQLVERGRWAEIGVPGGSFVGVRAPFGFADSVGMVRALGADTHAIEQELGLADAEESADG